MGINFWRCLTHWIGGMGVLVFVLMITSLDDENSMPLMRAEMPGPESDKLVPKARNTATILYGMYFCPDSGGSDPSDAGRDGPL